MVKYALKIFGKNLQLMLDISYMINLSRITCLSIKFVIIFYYIFFRRQ